jgi:A1 cistron-splicing factor AAR2
MGLIAQVQLSFILLLHLSSFSALQVYKRLLTLLCHSPAFLISPSQFLPAQIRAGSTGSPCSLACEAYVVLLDTLAAQLAALPQGAFETELPEMDVFYLSEIETLRVGLRAASIRGEEKWCEEERQKIQLAWERLKGATMGLGWDAGDIEKSGVDSEEEDEEGEYAPVIVEM